MLNNMTPIPLPRYLIRYEVPENERKQQLTVYRSWPWYEKDPISALPGFIKTTPGEIVIDFLSWYSSKRP